MPRVIPDDSGGRLEVVLQEAGRRFPVTMVEIAQFDPPPGCDVASETIILRLVDASLLRSR